VTGQWFSPVTSKTDHHDVTEILLKVALNTINPNPNLTGFELTTLLVIGTDYTGSCKSNYHTITMAPKSLVGKSNFSNAIFVYDGI
jgi:hypothetical protein